MDAVGYALASGLTIKGDTWASKAAMPTARYGLAVSAVNDKVYAIGGYNGTANVATNEEYNPSTNTWASKAAMPTARRNLTSGVMGGKIYAIGGYAADYSATNEEYDPATNTWASKASMPTARHWLACQAVGTKLYAVGGTITGGTATTANEEYDPATNTWASKAAMPAAKTALAAGGTIDKLYVFGGNLDTYEYTPTSNTWTTKAYARFSQEQKPGGVAINGKMYCIGGQNNASTTGSIFSFWVSVYDPATNEWGGKKYMITERRELEAAVVNGKIYAIGGYNTSTSAITAACEEYTPEYIDGMASIKGWLATQ